MHEEQAAFVQQAETYANGAFAGTNRELAPAAYAECDRIVDQWALDDLIDDRLVPLLAVEDRLVRFVVASQLLRVGFGEDAEAALEQLASMVGYTGALAKVQLVRLRMAQGDDAGAQRMGADALAALRGMTSTLNLKSADGDSEQ